MSYSQTTAMTYAYLETSDIHEIRLHGATRQTMDEFFELITKIYYSTPTSDVRRIMIIHSGPAIPISYFTGGMRSFISEHRKRARPVPARFAIVVEKNPFLQLVTQMLKLMRHQDQVMFFDQNEEAKATTWLTQP